MADVGSGYKMAQPRNEPSRNSLNRLTLRFRDPEPETAYQAARLQPDLRYARMAFLMVVLLNAAFAVVEDWLHKSNADLIRLLRLGPVTVVILVLYGLTFMRHLKTRYSALFVFLAIFYSCFYAASFAYAEPTILYIAGFMTVIIGVYVFIPFDFVVTTVTGWTAAVIAIGGAFAAHALTAEQTAIFAMQLFTVNTIGMYALYRINHFRRLDFINLEVISAERSRYQELLVSILPHSIADRLQRGERRIADHFDESTVLFADIAGFTKVSAAHTPDEMVDYLNRIFGQFDTLVEKHEVEKIKTIGDAYMVAGGIPRERPNHTEAIANLALDMIEVAKLTKGPDAKPVQLRVGIHTGPLIAGVIGQSRFLYDLWGDTVNVASRMESLGEAGRIQVTEDVYLRLRGNYDFERRGEIDVKGKGSMATWYLTGRQPAATIAE